MNRDREQVSTHRVTINAIMRRKAFLDGMRDAFLGEPISDAWREMPEQWSYERGRQFGAATGKLTLCVRKGSVSEEEQAQYIRLRQEGVIL